MAWDSSRPVPYRRLVREWFIYAAIMAGVFLLLLRDSTSPGRLFIGLAVSLPLYIGFSAVLAKFGYQRKTLADLRTPRAPSEPAGAAGAATGTPTGASAATSTGRTRPAPTRRTSGGSNRPGGKKRR